MHNITNDRVTTTKIQHKINPIKQLHNLAILSLNVCGIKGKLMSEEFRKLCRGYDILCMCETKCDDVDMVNVREEMLNIGFDIVYKNRSELSRFKSGGIIIAIQNNNGLKWKCIKNNNETFISIRLYKSSTGYNLQRDLIISAVYIPPSHSKYASIEHFNELDNFLLQYNYDNFHILCGDYNAHTGKMDDIIVNEEHNEAIDMYTMNSTSTAFNELHIEPCRFNQDISVDRSTYGKKLIEVCKNNEILIYNGRLGKDYRVGKATTTFNTTLDYVLGSPQIMKYVYEFDVLDYDPMYSDVHCGIHMKIRLGESGGGDDQRVVDPEHDAAASAGGGGGVGRGVATAVDHTLANAVVSAGVVDLASDSGVGHGGGGGGGGAAATTIVRHIGDNGGGNVNDDFNICNDGNSLNTPNVRNYVKPGRWERGRQNEYIRNIDEGKVHQLVDRVDQMSVEEITGEMNQILVEPAFKVFPPKSSRKYIKPSNNANMYGYDRVSWQSRKQYHKAKTKYNKHKNNSNYNELLLKSKKYKQELKRISHKRKIDLVKQIKDNKKKDPQIFWKIFNNKAGKNDTNISLDAFYDHFKNISCEEEENEPIQHEFNLNDVNSLNNPITECEVLRNIKKLKNNKSPGNDKILNEYIKCTQDLFCPLYIKLFNKILDTGIVPKEWLVGTIIPLYKNKGDTNDTNNYRGITLLSCLGKLFTSILNERLYIFSNDNNIINETQAGFRQGYSTLDHIFVLKSIIDLFCWKKRKLFCLFVDYQKAFDTIWRDGLWYKLVKQNVNGKILRVIKNMYNDIKSCVMLKQQLSDTFICTKGVRQGENLSPLLFAFYVNDIEDNMLNSNCNYIDFNDAIVNTYLNLFILMYADDTVILCDSEDGMKRALLALENYCNAWKLQLNCNKTKIVIFSRGKVNMERYDFKFGTGNIEVVSEYKYLGLTFNYNGRFRRGELELKQQATRAMYALIGKSRKFDLPVDMMLDLFNAMVKPVMLYASEVWGHYVIREIEQLHMKFLKHILYVHKFTSNDIVYGELGEFPIAVDINLAMIGYWTRLITGKTTKLSYVMYKCLLHLDQAGLFTSPWLNHIKSICNNCGLSGVWLTQNVIDPRGFKLAVERQLKDQWVTQWNEHLTNKAICSTYRTYKSVFCIEDYLLKLEKGDRIIMTKLRAGNNKLPVITGRHRNINREERICTKCNDNVVGDEYHLLFVCQNEDLVRLRNEYISHFYRQNPTQNKHILLMSNSNKKIMMGLVKFLRKAFSMYR